MAIQVPSTRTEPVPGSLVKLTITSADDGDGQYELLPVHRNGRGISVKLSGTAGGATFKVIYKNQTDDTFEDFGSGAIAPGEELNINCGPFTEVYLDAASTGGSTNVDIEASVYKG